MEFFTYFTGLSTKGRGLPVENKELTVGNISRVQRRGFFDFLSQNAQKSIDRSVQSFYNQNKPTEPEKALSNDNCD